MENQSKQTFNEMLSALLRSNRRHVRYLQVLVILAAFVAVVVPLSMRQSGVAMTTTETRLSCHYAGSGAHTHNDDCYDEQGNLVCPLAEKPFHTHTSDCYATERVLTCALPETEGHTHGDACYDEEGNLTCTLQEEPAHTHTDACYETRTTDQMICGLEETTEEHVHGPACFETVTVQASETEPATAVEEDAMPEQELTGTLKAKDENGNEYVVLSVQVKAPQGALPKGSTMSLAHVDLNKKDDLTGLTGQQKLDEALRKEAGDEAAFVKTDAVDITFKDAQGNRVDPAKKVEVRITTAGIRTFSDLRTAGDEAVANNSLMVLHVVDQQHTKRADAPNAEVVRESVLVNSNKDDHSTGHEDTILFEAQEFSSYVVARVDGAANAPAAEAQAEAEQPAATDQPLVEATIDLAGDDQSVAADAKQAAQAFSHRFVDTSGQTLLTVNVSAPEGAFPLGTTMRAEWVSAIEVEGAVSEAVAERTDGKLVDLRAVDITFLDADGNEIEPAKKITVTFTSDLIDTADDSHIVHIDDKGKAEVVDALGSRELQKREIADQADELVFESDQFSTYVVAITSLHKELAASDGATYDITVDAPAEAGIPQDAELSVTEIVPGTVSYEDYLWQAMQALGVDAPAEDAASARFFDIKIMSGEEEIQPQAPVKVSVKLADAASADSAAAVHFVGDVEGTTEVLEATQEDGTTTFDATGFSVYGVIYTVDFHWDVDGQTYDFSINGGDALSLRELLVMLGVVEADEAEAFVAQVADVAFSDAELVAVAKVDEDITAGALKAKLELHPEYSSELSEDELAAMDAKQLSAGDWALISLKAFDTTETLTITMSNGDVYTIRVTDAQISKTFITAEGDTYRVTVTYDETAQIPDGADLRVDEILPETEEYYEYYRKAIDLVCEDDGAESRHGYGRLFDISIWSGEEEIEPQGAVQVSIKLADAPEESYDLRVVHFGEDEPEVMALEAAPETGLLSTTEESEDTSETELRFETNAFSLYAVVSTHTSNGYGLDGQKLAIVNPNNSRTEAVLGRSQENNTALAASEVAVQQIEGKSYLVGAEITLWEFENVSGNVYYVKAPNGQYMHVGNGIAYLSNSPQRITVSQSGNGLRLDNSGYGLNAWNRKVADGFRAGTYNDDASRFTLYGVNELIQNQADKISLTDLVNLHTGETPIEEVVIYTRIENQTKDGYDYYAVAADGSLTPVFDIGDTIGWTSINSDPEHLKWKLTVHSSGGEHNGYFDFQSMENNLYLIPTAEGGIKEDDPNDSWDVGVNMPSWKSDGSGTYGSSIERWDSGSREYVGYAYDAANKRIVPTADESQKLEFLFAHVKEDPTPNQLHEVATLDGKTKGITIKMYDFSGQILNNDHNRPRSVEMTNVMGTGSISSTNVNGVGYANRGLVSETLTNGMPTATLTNRSLGNLFNDAHFISDASNIFVQQVYDETGYFSYDSSKNYAYLDQSQKKFILYRELAAPQMEAKNWSPSGQKGNFFPFDSLQELADNNEYFTNGITVKYDGDLQEMSPDNPQYGEKLYRIAEGQDNNYKSYFFGMTMEADFYQGANGKDDRGNDIIYEFNGDDDMWLYIDDRLVLDIGGCHGAVSGTINFSTGEVRVNGSDGGVRTTLKKIFQDAEKLPDGSDWSETGAAKWFRGNTFADYTKHSFKMFYMERGSYASNLKMSFNLMTIEPGVFVLEKKLPENVQLYGEQTFAYQIYTVSGGQETLYTPPEGKQVTYEKTGNPVPIDQDGNSGFKSTYTIGGQNYNNVYLLKPYEPIVIPTIDDDVKYYVREIGIPNLYTEVKANDQTLNIETEQEGVRVAATDVDAVKTRGRVTYENIPSETHTLRLEKLVQGQVLNANDSFRFDVQLEDATTGNLVPFSMGKYYVVKTDESGVDHYYKYVDGKLEPSEVRVAYTSGISGAIDRIFPGYTIVIPGLLPGTDFKVMENQSAGEYPAGYSYVKTDVQNAGAAQIEGAQGHIQSRSEEEVAAESYKDALVQITNTSGMDVTLVKVDEKDVNADNPNRLKGASFTLTKYTDGTFTEKDTSWGTKGSKTLSDEKVEGEDAYTLNGLFEFEQLTAGYYKIEETRCPAGYIKTTGDQTFKVELDGSNGLKVTLIDNPGNLLRLEDNGLRIVVGNPPGAELPEAGGPGTYLHTLCGLALFAAAGYVGIASRRKESEDAA